MTRGLRVIISVLVGAALAALIAFAQTHNLAPSSDAGFIGQPFGGDFAGLMDQDGKLVERDSFAGKYELVFFGFTHCPAICPTELQKITTAMKTLTPAQRAQLVPIFVTVDPARDTPDVLKSYISVFDQGFVGLTGKQDILKRVFSDWKVYAAKVPTEDGSDYTMDHSAFLYLRDPQGALLGLYHNDETAEALAKDLAAQIKP